MASERDGSRMDGWSFFGGTRPGKREALLPADSNQASMNFKFRVGESRIDGKGLFASARIPARRKLGEFTGQVISQRQARWRARGRQRIAIVELNDGRAIDASRGGNDFRYINHSCSANAYIRISRGRVEFYSRRGIKAGEEITCDYGETHHEGKLRCQCGSKNCRGYL